MAAAAVALPPGPPNPSNPCTDPHDHHPHRRRRLGPGRLLRRGHLLKQEERRGSAIEVDMLERLPTPWGLVRSGVAPDHPKIKSVTQRVREDGRAPPLPLLRQRRGRARHSHARSWPRTTTRSSTPSARSPTARWAFPARTCRAATPPSTSSAGTTATPTSATTDFDLSCERAVVIGNGNVALDVARMLGSPTRSWPSPTSPTTRWRRWTRARSREVVVIGRRGPAAGGVHQPWSCASSATSSDADVIVDPAELERASSEEDAAAMGKTAEPTSRSARLRPARAPAGPPPAIVLRFLLSPVEMTGDGTGRGRSCSGATSS